MYQRYFGILLLLLATSLNVHSQVNKDYQDRSPLPARPPPPWSQNSSQNQPRSGVSGAYDQDRPPVWDSPAPQAPSGEVLPPLAAVADAPAVGQNTRFISQPNNPAAETLSRGNEIFSLTFFKSLVELIENHDFIVSPFSIYSLLATLTEGASNPSETLNELLNVLQIPPQLLNNLGDIYSEIVKKLLVKTDTIELSLFQGIFNNYTYPLEQQFKNTVERKYVTKCEQIEGGRSADDILKRINAIVSQSTNGNLQSAFSKREIQGAALLLLSVIHFKGQWAHPFNRTYTKTEPFYDEYGRASGNVQMMFERSPVAFAPIKELESHVVQLPYGQQNRLSMIVILPRKNVTLSTVAAKLLDFKLADMFRILERSLQDYEDDEIEVHLPKFTTNSDLALNALLQKMGLNSVFTSDAQLNRMNPDIFLSRLIHKAKIEVDEEGTVASAVTGGVFANKSSAPRFYANRPFLYMIIDKATQLILFCGQMRNNPYNRH